MLDLNHLPNAEVAYRDISLASEEEFALARRDGFGASDSSVLLGLQKAWKTPDDTIREKLRTQVTDEEREIGAKVVVRKGKDLEPLTLQKFEKLTGIQVIKPPHMYRINEFGYLTINYDGLADTADGIIPVEAKFVSTYGDKHYNRNKATIREVFIEKVRPVTYMELDDDCTEQAVFYGIPAYYYAQLQHQMIGSASPYGYLVALHDKDWEVCIYGPIPANPLVQAKIKAEGFKNWQKVLKLRGV